jgi:class 3 adenylate cyclase
MVEMDVAEWLRTLGMSQYEPVFRQNESDYEILPEPTDPDHEVRIGIATGLVVVGDLVGEGALQEEAVVSETSNLAARPQALAEPGSVVIAPARARSTAIMILARYGLCRGFLSRLG